MNIRDFLLVEREHMDCSRTAAGELTHIKVPFAVAGMKSESGKTYSAALLKKACDEFNQHISARPAYGAATRIDGALQVGDVSHMIEHTYVRDGKAWATLRLLPTRKGSDLIKILNAGGTVGAAMRGIGRTDSEGVVLEMTLSRVDITLQPNWQGTVASEACFESMDVGADEKALHHRWEMAVRLANYRGTFDEYRRAMRKR